MASEISQFLAEQPASSKMESLRPASAVGVPDKTRVAQEFASFLFLEVLKAMRSAMPQAGFMETESVSRDIYTSMMDAEIARLMARHDVTGFSNLVERSLEAKAPNRAKENEAQPPLKGVVSSQYGPRKHPITGLSQFHKGIDIAAPAGSPIQAVAAGTVVFSGWKEAYGNLIEIDHGAGTTTRYAHNADNRVSTGDTVQAGQTIGLVGNTGRSTNSHLHFELWRNGKSVDPEFVLDQDTKGVNVNAKF